MGLADRIIHGDARAAARLITLLENNTREARGQMDALYPHTGRAAIIGVTGAAGTGKSTLVGGLITHLRRQGKTVGVVAIDPTSDISGGAMLGDRLRMQQHSTDPGVFIRSLATRGWSGGLSRAALGTVHVLDALGKDVIFIETVGAGQVETDIAAAADTTLVVLNPGAGDDIQTLKAGIMEAADVFVINKADRDGAAVLKADLEAMPSPAPVVLTTAIDNKGVDELAGELERHRQKLETTGQLAARRQQRIRLELLEILEAAWRDSLRDIRKTGLVDERISEIIAGKREFQQVSAELLSLLAEKLGNGHA